MAVSYTAADGGAVGEGDPLAHVLLHSGDVACVIDRGGAVLAAGPAWSGLGASLRDWVADRSAEAVEQALQAAGGAGGEASCEVTLHPSDVPARLELVPVDPARILVFAAPVDPPPVLGSVVASAASVGLAVVDAGGRFRYLNDAFAETYRLSRDRLLGQSFLEVVAPESREVAWSVHEAVIREGRAQTREFETRRGDGSPMSITAATRRIRLPDGECMRLVSVFDVTELRENEQRLAAAELRLRALTESLPGAVYQFRHDPDGGGYRFTYMSRGLHALGGFPPEYPLDDFPTFMRLVRAEDQPGLQQAIAESERNFAPLRHRFRLETPNGTLWLEARSRPTREDDGTIVCNGFLDNVTEIAAAQQALTDERNLLSEIISNRAFAVVVLEPDGTVLRINPRARELLALPEGPAPTLDDCGAEVEAGDGRRGGARQFLLDDALAAGTPLEGRRLLFRWPDGGSRMLSANVSPVSGDDGEVRRVVVALGDVSYGIEAHMRAILEHTPAMVFLKDLDGRYLYINPEFERHYGVTNAQARGRTIRELLGAEAAAAFESRDGRALAERGLVRAEIRVPPRERGQEDRIFDALKFPVLDEDGEPIALAGVEFDVTERHEAAARLTEQRHLLEEIVETSVSALLITTHRGALVHANPRARELLRLDEHAAESLLDLPAWLTRPDGSELPAEEWPLQRMARETQAIEDMRIALHWTDGQRQVLSVNASPVPGSGGRPRRVVFSFLDLTEDSDARERMERQHALFRSISDNSSEVMIVADVDRRITMVNRAFTQVFGFSEDEVVGLPTRTVYANADDHARVGQTYADRISGRTSRAQMHEVMFRTRDGREFPAETVTDLLYDAHGEHIGYVGFIRDVTERRRAEERLARSEERYRMLYHRTPVMLHSIDREGRIVAVSGYWLHHLGYAEEDVIGHRITEFMTQESARYSREQKIPEFFRTGRASNVPYQLVRADGSVIDVLLSSTADYDEHGQIDQSLSVMVDVTEQRRVEAEYRQIFERTTDGVFRSTPDGRLLQVNPALARMHGFETPDELYASLSDLNRDWYVDASVRDELHRRLERDGMVDGFEAKVQPLNGGSPIWTSETVHATHDARGNVLYYEGTIRDITSEYKARTMTDHRNRLLEMVARDADVTDVLYEVVGAAEDQEETLTVGVFLLEDCRFRAVAAPGVANECLNALEGVGPQSIGGMMEEALITSHQVVGAEARNYRSGEDGFIDAMATAGYGAMVVTPIRDQEGNNLGVLTGLAANASVFTRDCRAMLREMAQISSIAIEQHRLARELMRQARYDMLTDLPNRTLLTERLDGAVREAYRNGDEVGVLLLDLDEFKLVNDSLGHSAGDELLQDVARRLQECVRAGDTVARLGGDEFVVVAPLRHGSDYCTSLAERVVEMLQERFEVGGEMIAAHPSIGISIYPADGRSPEALLKAADTAMYVAKHSGKNQYHFFAEDMNERVSERLRTESELHTAIAEGQLVLEFQPRLCLRDGKITGAEGLIRWNHPEKGRLLPGAFIETAERSAMMGQLSNIVLDQAIAQLRALRDHDRRVIISINLSAGELHTDSFGQRLGERILDSGIDPSALELEITESMLMRNFERSAKQLRVLKERAPGLRVAIDDFGSGYSSLNYLRHLPIDTLKIDRSFVSGLSRSDPTSGAIAKTIIELAHNLKMSAVAEGIEELEQLAVLQSFGCDEGQGFLFDAAMTAEQFGERLAREPVYPQVAR